MTDKKRLLTGDRPTGKLHLGHLVGSITTTASDCSTNMKLSC